MKACCTIVSLLALLSVRSLAAQDGTFRVATYNIKFLDTGDPDNRIEAIKRVIAGLNAHAIALQEIDDRDALEKIFDDDDWQIVIDDDSGNSQDVAVAVRDPLVVVRDNNGDGTVEETGDFDAEPSDFLFPNSADNLPFPKRRDVLNVQVQVPGVDIPVHLFVVHAKARGPSRPDTNFRRADHGRRLLDKLETEFEDVPFILLGDFNDNPDDEGLNILETGVPTAPIKIENTPGAFLVNLTEPLLLDDVVTWSTSHSDVVIIDGKPIKSGSRNFNFDNADNDVGPFSNLLDHILIPTWMIGHAGEVKVFTDVPRDDLKLASDHFPVIAEFTVAPGTEIEHPAPAGVRIASLLPNPQGRDQGNEKVVIKNHGTEAQSLDGWTLVDKADHELDLDGIIAAGASMTIAIPRGELPLNNSGDDISLFDAAERLVHKVSYSSDQAVPGETVSFGG